MYGYWIETNGEYFEIQLNGHGNKEFLDETGFTDTESVLASGWVRISEFGKSIQSYIWPTAAQIKTILAIADASLQVYVDLPGYNQAIEGKDLKNFLISGKSVAIQE